MPRISNAEVANRRRYLEAHVQGAPRGTGCWEWPFSINTDGYGTLGSRGRVHVMALELDGRPKPYATAQARHTCDNPPCFNPDHLNWGTAQDNADDRNIRDRHNRGEDVNTAKLTPEKVQDIRSRYVPRGHPNGLGNGGKLAREYGISTAQLSKIVRRIDWAHVE